MKIAILSRTQGRVFRGVESFVFELSSRLKISHQVDILSGKDSDNFIKIVKGGYDIVMPMNGRAQVVKVSVGRLLGGYKMVVGGHSGIGRDDIFNIFIGKPDVFVALTGYMAKWAEKWAWGSRVVKINNGVDLEKFKPSGEKVKLDLKGKVVLSVGALTWYKFHEKVIEAVSKLEDVSLLIVGVGEEKENLERLGREKLGKRIQIKNVPYEEMPKIYRGVDLFTLPSWDREAFGLVYLEAMASGVPVVAPDDLSRKEIVGDGGILVDVDNADEYAEAIKKALSLKWDDKPRRQAEKFSWDKVSKEYENLFEKLINEK